MSTTVLLVSFETPEPISVDDRHGIKDLLGQIVRAGLGQQVPVNIDHLESSEPHVAALLPVVS